MQVIVILILASSAMHDGIPSGAGLPTGSGALLMLAPFAVLALANDAWQRRCARALDRTGRSRTVASADAAMSVTRWGAVAAHMVNVFWLGWVGAVRSVVGEMVLVDDLAAAAPALLTIVAAWWSHYPVERRVRDARFFGALERGETVYPPRTRWQYVGDQARHSMLFVLAPLSLILGWSEFVALAEAAWGPSLERWLGGAGNVADAAGAAQIAGALAVFLASPEVLRRVWDTAPLGAGWLREDLLRMCARQGVRVRDLLVWRTHGSMINGAVMGLIPRVRYILLTDALLDSLGEEQVQAVLAHELGHVRRRHIPWLAAAMIVAVVMSASIGAFIAALAQWAWPEVWHGEGVLAESAGVLPLAALPVAVLAVGGVSRRFERQADAFAVAHLSGLTAEPGSAKGKSATREAVDAMASALRAVAALNGVPLRRRFWRHGSLQGRIDAIERLEGLPLDRLPPDRAARRDTIAAAIGLALLAGVAANGWVLAW